MGFAAFGFHHEELSPKPGVAHHLPQRFPDPALTQIGVLVNMATPSPHRVIEVDERDPFEPDFLVKLLNHPLWLEVEGVTSGEGVAGIEADA